MHGMTDIEVAGALALEAKSDARANEKSLAVLRRENEDWQRRRAAAQELLKVVPDLAADDRVPGLVVDAVDALYSAIAVLVN